MLTFILGYMCIFFRCIVVATTTFLWLPTTPRMSSTTRLCCSVLRAVCDESIMGVLWEYYGNVNMIIRNMHKLNICAISYSLSHRPRRVKLTVELTRHEQTLPADWTRRGVKKCSPSASPWVASVPHFLPDQLPAAPRLTENPVLGIWTPHRVGGCAVSAHGHHTCHNNYRELGLRPQITQIDIFYCRIDCRKKISGSYKGF